MKQEKRHPIQDLEPEDLRCLGECVRDLVACLGYGSSADPLQASLFCEAIDIITYMLTTRQGSRASLKTLREQYGDDPPEYHPITMMDLAQVMIAQTGETGRSIRSIQELKARAQFALQLESKCVEAYLLEGYTQERQSHFQKAEASYQRVIQLSMEQLGPDAFERAARKDIYFWHSAGTRPYMQARASLAYLLWQKDGKVQEGISHFRAMLELNPGDNQGNRYAIICCLLEEGDDEALAEALQRYFVYEDESGEEMDLRETCWHYTHACWQFRRASRESGRSGSAAASKALRTAFTYNKHVPYYLLRPEVLADYGELDSYGHGDEREAVWYARYALKSWQQTPGALDWLQAAARRHRLV
jgi:tetratricopeptide (TPR) repeat protein